MSIYRFKNRIIVPNSYPSGYPLAKNCRQLITIDHTKVSGTSDQNHLNFPVLVPLSILGDLFDVCRSDGGDIRVTLIDGVTQLAREIVDIDKVSRTGEMWVKIPELSTLADTSILIWYNGIDTEPSAGSAYGSESVWDSNYKSVYHMSVDDSVGISSIIDSTDNIRDCSTYGSMTSSDLVDGKIGDAIRFDSSLSQYASNYNPPVSDFPLTFQAWVKPATIATSAIVFVGDKDTTESFIALCLNSDGTARCFVHSYNISGGYKSAYSINTISIDTWGFFSCTVDAAGNIEVTLNSDFTNKGSESTAVTVSGHDVFAISGFMDATPGGYFDGAIDEIRISDVVRSNDWISTEYANQSSPDTFFR